MKNSLEYASHSIGAILNVYNSKDAKVKNDLYSFEIKKKKWF